MFGSAPNHQRFVDGCLIFLITEKVTVYLQSLNVRSTLLVNCLFNVRSDKYVICVCIMRLAKCWDKRYKGHTRIVLEIQKVSGPFLYSYYIYGRILCLQLDICRSYADAKHTKVFFIVRYWGGGGEYSREIWLIVCLRIWQPCKNCINSVSSAIWLSV